MALPARFVAVMPPLPIVRANGATNVKRLGMMGAAKKLILMDTEAASVFS